MNTNTKKCILFPGLSGGQCKHLQVGERFSRFSFISCNLFSIALWWPLKILTVGLYTKEPLDSNKRTGTSSPENKQIPALSSKNAFLLQQWFLLRTGLPLPPEFSFFFLTFRLAYELGCMKWGIRGPLSHEMMGSITGKTAVHFLESILCRW